MKSFFDYDIETITDSVDATQDFLDKIEHLNDSMFWACICLLVDSACERKGADPAEQTKTIANLVEIVNDEFGPMEGSVLPC